MMATMSNIERVQENIRRMQEQNAPANDVVGYLKSEGFTPTKFEAAVASARKLGGPPVEAGFGRSVLQGLTFNFADEIEAALRSGSISNKEYENQLARVRAGIKEYEQQYPGRAFAGEMIGGLAPTAAALIAAPFTGGATAPAAVAGATRMATKIPTLGGIALRGAGYGGVSGAISGAGGAEGGLEKRLAGAGIGGATGAVLGGASPVVTQAVSSGGKAVKSVFKSTQPQDALNKAQELIAKKLAQEGIDPAELARQQAMRNLTLGAKDETLADYGGESMRRLARGAMAIPQSAQTETRQMLIERAQGAGPRITQDITNLTAVGARDVQEVANEIVANRSRLAAPLYEEARSAGQISSPALNNLLTKSKDIQQAIGDARRLPQFADLPDNDMVMLDKAYKYVGGIANEARKAGKTNRANDLDELRVNLLDAIKKEVPVYGKAVQTFADESLLNDALEAGSKNFLKKRPSDINRELAKFSDESERQMYRLGAIQSVRDDIYGEKELKNIADKYLNSREMRDRMRTVFNSEGEYEAFVKNLERERQMAITRSRIEGGSPTALIGQDIAELAGPAPSEVISAGGQLMRGDLIGGGLNLMGQLAPRLQGMNENVAEQVARNVLNPSFAQQQELLTSLTPVMDELRRRALQQQTRAAGVSTSAGQFVPSLLAE
jgi:hypothetical protein